MKVHLANSKRQTPTALRQLLVGGGGCEAPRWLHQLQGAAAGRLLRVLQSRASDACLHLELSSTPAERARGGIPDLPDLLAFARHPHAQRAPLE